MNMANQPEQIEKEMEPIEEKHTSMMDIISKSELEARNMESYGVGSLESEDNSMASFFSIIAFLFQKEESAICTQAVIEESISVWQSQKASEKYAWRMLYPN